MSEQVYIALLRGINVGGKVLKMADLKVAVAPLGFSDIKTYLQSGNMVFGGVKAGDDTLADRISRAIKDQSALDVHVIVRTGGEWNTVVDRNPFPQAEKFPKTVHAFILERQPERQKVEDLKAKDFGSEQWQILGDTLYLHTPDGFGKSRLGGMIERALKVPMTARNWSTVLALKELATAT